MGEQSHLKDHYSRCQGTDVVRCARNVEYDEAQATERVRWGVWLGRHICYTITQVSYEELKETRNLLSNKRVEAPLIGRLSTSPNCESMAYRSFSRRDGRARGVRKVTTGITGLWQPSVHSDVAF